MIRRSSKTKRWIHDKIDSTDVEASAESEPKKLKRTPESGHSYDVDTTFENAEDFLKWCEEDKLYED